MREKVEAVLAEIGPMLQADGGGIDLVEITPEGTLKIKVLGFCPTCPNSMMPLREGIERLIKEQVPEVKEVIAV